MSITTYHHVADHDPSYPYDPDAADSTPAQFRWQMETLARHCTPIGIDDLLRALDGSPLPKNPVMVTFDDGYQSCHDVALPILRAVGIRATFFIATSFVNERKLYWWERVALLVNQATHGATLVYPKRLVLEPRSRATRMALLDTIKDTPNLDVNRFLVGVAAALGVPWNDEIEADYANGLIMTWDQIRALARAGMDVESHSRRHRVLQTLDADGLRDELAGSREDIESQLGRPVRAIAYPVGRRLGRGSERIRAAVAAAGYRIGLSNASGANRIWPGSLGSMLPFDRFDVRRQSLDRSMSDAMFLTQIAIPRFGYYGRHDD
ncbi:MAG: polysaccharide deacetylase family protein [Deltaproteobacteria bacterium]|nr:polysaccharide deacetylase family protein [Deltaproteobacteria bacterium]